MIKEDFSAADDLSLIAAGITPVRLQPPALELEDVVDIKTMSP